MNDIYATRCTLLDRARNQNDSLAWEELLAVYERYIYVIIRSMNISVSDTDELLQLVSIKLWKGLPDFKYQPGKSLFRNWVSRVTRNTVLNFLESQRARLARLDAAQKQQQLNYLNAITIPEVEVLEREEWTNFVTNTAFENIRSHFTDDVIRAFELYVENVPIPEIALQIGVVDRSIYNYIERVKSRLIDEVAILKKGLDL